MIELLEIDANCNSIFTPGALEIIREVFNYFRIIAPILVILFIAFDYSSAIISQNDDALKKANSRFIYRCIAVLLLFFVPTIVTAILNITPLAGTSTDYLCTNATGTEADGKFVASMPKKEKKPTSPVNPEDSDPSKKTGGSGGSGGSGSTGDGGSHGGSGGSGSTGDGGSQGGSGGSSGGSGSGGSSGGSSDGTKVGDKTNPQNTVCLKDSGNRDKYQAELEAKVSAAGNDSRAGVVAAAIYMSSEIGIKIPYFPGGCHSMVCLKKGIPDSIGCQKKVVHNAERWPSTLPGGFDCSGFVFWCYGAAFGQRSYISSEMHNANNRSTTVVNQSTGEKIGVKVEKVAITKDNYEYIKALLMPGDLIGSDGHVGMVIDTSKLQSEGKFTVAHSTSSTMQLTVEEYDLGTKKWNRFVLMRKFFLKYDCVNKNNQDACQKFDCIKSDSCNSNGIRY
jgi:cell wall-associated NlpC family hydrolase